MTIILYFLLSTEYTILYIIRLHAAICNIDNDVFWQAFGGRVTITIHIIHGAPASAWKWRGSEERNNPGCNVSYLLKWWTPCFSIVHLDWNYNYSYIAASLPSKTLVLELMKRFVKYTPANRNRGLPPSWKDKFE